MTRIVFPHALEFHKPTLAVESETLSSFGSRVLTALHLTIWSGSVDVILERRAWRMLVQENSILPDD
jgi:hypothetical protein